MVVSIGCPSKSLHIKCLEIITKLEPETSILNKLAVSVIQFETFQASKVISPSNFSRPKKMPAEELEASIEWKGCTKW